jgi:hypothetical protein
MTDNTAWIITIVVSPIPICKHITTFALPSVRGWRPHADPFRSTLSEARLGDILENRCDLLTNVFEDPIVSPGIRSAHLHSVFVETFAAT